jgi:hypothetical protein
MPRNKSRIETRNIVLRKRYKELYDIKRKRYDDVLEQLADEFYLTPATVNRIILQNSGNKDAKDAGEANG